jgi:hypothetical protein
MAGWIRFSCGRGVLRGVGDAAVENKYPGSRIKSRSVKLWQHGYYKNIFLFHLHDQEKVSAE